MTKPPGDDETVLTPERLAHLRGLATALRDDLELRGRWFWTGDIKWSGPMLSTRGGGRRVVMASARKGMNSAQPTFPHKRPGDHWPLLVTASEVPIFEVARGATSAKDPAVYRQDVVGIRNPVAEYLAEIDAETLLALLDAAEAKR